jgi:hypothetical protein
LPPVPTLQHGNMFQSLETIVQRRQTFDERLDRHEGVGVELEGDEIRLELERIEGRDGRKREGAALVVIAERLKRDELGEEGRRVRRELAGEARGM